MLPGVRAVCFDLGGVLIRIHHDWSGAVRAAAVASGLSGPLGGFPEFDRYQAGEATDEQFLAALGLRLGGLGREEARAVHMAVLREEYPGVSELVATLVESGVVCGCLSNTNALHWATFFEGSRFGFGPRLSVRVGSHIERLQKPDERIYRLFEERAGTRQIAYFDDGPANVEAARRLGWRAWLVDPAGDPASQIRASLGL